MNSKLITTALLLALGGALQAQNVGIGIATPHASAQLEISSTNKGLLIPRVTQANRPASPATGLLIYQTNNTPGFYFFNGTGWKPLNGFWMENGNHIFNGNSGYVGIGTSTPNFNLQVHNSDNLVNDASIQLTNNWSGNGLNDGLRIRIYNEGDVTLTNRENGLFSISTNLGALGAYGSPVIVLQPSGAVGIGTSTPNAKLEVAGQVKITGGGPGAGKVLTSDASGLATWEQPSGGFWTNSGSNIYNTNGGTVGVSITPTSFAQFHVKRPGVFSAAPVGEIGAIYGENGNETAGSGVVGISNAPRTGATGYAGITGMNLSTATDRFGVIGLSTGTSGSATPSAGVGGYGDYGVLGFSLSATGAGIIAQHGLGNTALEINNGFIKVSGANKTAFRVSATSSNTVSNHCGISYSGASSTDLVFVTPYWDGVYLNAPIGVYWTGSEWRIFRQDLAAMPLGAKFNVLVIKQ